MAHINSLVAFTLISVARGSFPLALLRSQIYEIVALLTPQTPQQQQGASKNNSKPSENTRRKRIDDGRTAPCRHNYSCRTIKAFAPESLDRARLPTLPAETQLISSFVAAEISAETAPPPLLPLLLRHRWC